MSNWKPETCPAVSTISTRPVCILHGFDIPLQQITVRLSEFSRLGFSHVQIPPVCQTYPTSFANVEWATRVQTNEPASITPWWLAYQPAMLRDSVANWADQAAYTLLMGGSSNLACGFRIGNALGSRADLISLTATAKTLGVSVIADVVPNQIGSVYNVSSSGTLVVDTQDTAQFVADLNGDQAAIPASAVIISTTTTTTTATTTTTTTGTLIPAYYFHPNNDGLYTDQWFPPAPQDPLPDLNTSHQDVLVMIAQNWQNLLDCGVTGFRVDGLKQMTAVDVRRMFRMMAFLAANPTANTPALDIAFYNATNPNGYLNDTFTLSSANAAMFVYGETIDLPNVEIGALGAYQPYKGVMPQTDYVLEACIKQAIVYGGKLDSLVLPLSLGDRDAVTFGVTHDFHVCSALDTLPSQYKGTSDLITFYPNVPITRFQQNTWNSSYAGATDSYFMQYLPECARDAFLAIAYVLARQQGIPLVMWQDVVVSPAVRAGVYFRRALSVFFQYEQQLTAITTITTTMPSPTDPLLGYAEWCCVPKLSATQSLNFVDGMLLVMFRARGVLVMNKSGMDWPLDSSVTLICPASSGAGPVGTAAATFVDVTNAQNMFSASNGGGSSNQVSIIGTAIAPARTATFFLDVAMVTKQLVPMVATFTLDSTRAQPSGMYHPDPVAPVGTVTLQWTGTTTSAIKSMSSDAWLMKQPVWSTSDLSDNTPGQQWQYIDQIPNAITALTNVTFTSIIPNQESRTLTIDSLPIPINSCILDVHASL